MSARRRARRAVLFAAALGSVLLGAVAAPAVEAASHPASSPAVAVGGNVAAPVVPNAFLGISSEIKNLLVYAGTSTSNLDQPFIQLLRNLAPTGTPVLRLAGDSSDWSWWPVPGMAQPGGVHFDLSTNWTAVAKAVVGAINGKLMVGINFEADSRRLAQYEVEQLRTQLGSTVTAYELGNEPELYDAFSWYRTKTGQRVNGRAPGYDIGEFTSDWGNIAAALPNVPIAAPSTGSAVWFDGLGTFLARDRARVSLVTVHAYPLKRCLKTDVNHPYQLLQSSSLQGLVNGLGPALRAAGRYHIPVRLDELNGVSCGGEVGVSNSFAEALWALNVLPLLERAGVSGVNFHTVPGGAQDLISASDSSKTGWQVAIQPAYYGMMTFATAAPAGAHFLRIQAPTESGMFEWATRAPDGTVHVVLTNTSSSARTLPVQIAGAGGTATATMLDAASINSTTGVTLAGETISSTTGQLTGTPVVTTVKPSGPYGRSGARYPVHVPGSSAVVLTVGG
jgi:hypothetical protein